MPSRFPVTSIDIDRVNAQINDVLWMDRHTLRRSSERWKGHAIARSKTLARLNGEIDNFFSKKNRHLTWIADRKTDLTNWAKQQQKRRATGGADTDVDDLVIPLQQFMTEVAAMPRSTYAQIITVCDFIESEVNAPLSLWVE